MNINKVILCGQIGRVGTLRYFDDGTATVDVSLATTETWQSSGPDDPGERTDWHRLEFRGVDAINIAKYAITGQELYVEGSARVRSYKEGNERKFIHFVDAKHFKFGRKPKSVSADATEPRLPQAATTARQRAPEMAQQPVKADPVPAAQPPDAPPRRSLGRRLRMQRQTASQD